MESLLQDLRFGARVLLRTPLVSISIVAVLALGIGANSAMFGILDALLLHSVRYPDPQSLVFVWSLDAHGALSDASAADFMDWRAKSKTLSDLTAWIPTSMVFLGGERPRQLGAARVTANFFRTLRVKPVLGRTFLPDEDGLENPANAARSVVISSRLWKEDLGSDPNVLGRTVRLDSIPYTIVGVMPPDFQFWWRPHDLWVPASLKVQERDYRDLVIVGRTNSPRARVSAEMDVIAKSLGEAYPKSDKGWTILIENIQDRLLNQTFRARLMVLTGAVGFVLLIACTNVAGLLLARSAARNRELAVRVSLGATGWRLARQLLTESALLALIGGGLGLAIAWGLIRALPAFVPAGAIPGGPIELSPPVIWFCLATSALTCLLVGLAPAITAARSETQSALKDASRGTTAGRGRQRFRQILVAGEVALALILVVGAWLMVVSLRALTSADAGFDPTNVLTLRLLLPAAKYDAAHAQGFYTLALEKITSVPGVESATLATSLPLANSMMVRFDREDSPRDEAQQPSAPYAAVGIDYFKTLRIPLKRGRMFTDADHAQSKLVAIVTEALAARFFPDQDPIGRQMVVFRPFRGGEQMTKLEIVGVVGNINLSNLSLDPRPMIYAPYPQNPFARGVQFAIRTSGNPSALASAVRRELMTLDREQPIEQVGSLEQALTAQFAQPRFQTNLMGSFAALALVLAALGIYGVNSYAVTQRRNEIGVRMALGASRSDVLRDVIGQGLRPTAIGIVVGLIVTAMLASWLKSFLIGAGSLDPIAFFGAAFVLGIVAVVACYLPARKAIRIDPAITLRSE